ncbi:MAG: amidohydrolase family protein [Gemmatimonadota bacterium]
MPVRPALPDSRPVRTGSLPLRSIFAALLLAPILLAACGEAPSEMEVPDSADLVLTGVHVVDVVAGEVHRNRQLAISDGRVTALLDDPEAAAGIDATEVIQTNGHYVIPGLWDMHVHFRGGEELIEENRALAPLYIAHGVTTVRDAGGDIAPAIMEWRDEMEAGTLTGPRILTSGPKIDGPSGGWDGSIRLTEADQVAAAFDSLQALGVDYVKLYDGTTPREVFLEALAEAERRNMIVTGHMPYSVLFEEAIEGGLDAIEHLYFPFKGSATNEDSVTMAIRESAGTDNPLGFWQALGLLIPAYDEARAQEVFTRMASAGMAALPTLHIMDVLSWVDEVDHSDDPELQYIHPAIQETYQGRVQGAINASESARQERRELQRIFIEMVQPMHEAGVRILAGSDAGPFNSHVYPGTGLHSELEALVDAGLTPAEALRAATIHAAEFMRLGDELGQIAPGYRADLVLLSANPLEEISNTRQVAAVILDGRRVLDAGDLETLLESIPAEWD